MRQLNLTPGGKHRKCAKISGDTSGDYHPHGEQVIYPTLVRMAQDWAMRYTLSRRPRKFWFRRRRPSSCDALYRSAS